MSGAIMVVFIVVLTNHIGVLHRVHQFLGYKVYNVNNKEKLRLDLKKSYFRKSWVYSASNISCRDGGYSIFWMWMSFRSPDSITGYNTMSYFWLVTCYFSEIYVVIGSMAASEILLYCTCKLPCFALFSCKVSENWWWNENIQKCLLNHFQQS